MRMIQDLIFDDIAVLTIAQEDVELQFLRQAFSNY